MAFNFNENTPKRILYNGLNVAKLVYNGVVVWMSKLPIGYTEVEYLESTGTQYIDTGINVNTTTSRYETKINPSSVSGTIGIFGTRNYSSANQSSMNVFIISGTFRLDWVTGNGNYNVRNISSDTEYTISITRGLATINNVDYTSGETTSIDSTYPFYIGSFNNVGSVFSTGFSGKIYYSKLYNNNILVFDGVPCYRNSDNEIGMYDLVSNTFFTNQGTGTFNVGPVVSIPIPNPDYPQDVRVITGNNSVKVIGKNLFDKDNPNIIHKQATSNLTLNTDSHFVSIYVPAKEGETYTISSTSNLFDTYASLYFTSEDLNTATTCLSRTVRSNVTSSITATAPVGAKYVCSYIMYSNNQTDINSLLETIQLEKGSTATTYEPYQSQTYPINLGTIELCKIGSYQDYIYKENGKWYLHKEIGKVVLDGSNYPLYGDGGSSTDYWEYSRTGMTGGIGTRDSVKTNYFNQTTNSRIVILSNGGLYFRFPKSSGIDVSTYTLLNTWLSTHNTIVYYVLATTTNTEITDTTLISQLNAIETYTGTNTFSVSNSNDVLPTINVERLKELDKLS